MLLPALQRSPPIDVPPPGQQWGGGNSTTGDASDARVVSIADSLRRLGQAVNQPGLKAIKAVLLISTGKTVSEAVNIAGTTKPSISKYRPLVDQVVGACTASTVLASTAVLVGGPVAAGMTCGAIAATVLAPSVKSLPNVSNVHLHREIDDGTRLHRVWHANRPCA